MSVRVEILVLITGLLILSEVITAVVTEISRYRRRYR